MPTFTEAHIEVDGFRIRYAEAGEGDSVVILDGMTWGPSTLNDALALAYRVVVMELPGFGYSPNNAGSRSVTELANTVARVVAAVVADSYTLIGTSFGADLALQHSLEAPGNLEALILVSPTAIRPMTSPIPETPEEMAQQLLAHPSNLGRLSATELSIFAKEQALIQWLKGTHQDEEVQSRLKEIRCPTLVVMGLEDRRVAPEAASIYRESIPNCNVCIVYDAGHLIAAERPEALVGAVSDFVERRETFVVGRGVGIINP
jgi:pimeloyl-ACP methyl ester carboxylesterase